MFGTWTNGSTLITTGSIEFQFNAVAIMNTRDNSIVDTRVIRAFNLGFWYYSAIGVAVEWSKGLTAVPWQFMVWSTLALCTYQLSFISWVFHVNFSFVHFISLYTLGGLHAFRKPLPYKMYLFNLRIANHILIKNGILCSFSGTIK